MKYIDVSEWQGVIDWEKAKPHIDGAIIRAGYGKGTPDKRFTYNASECNRLGIPCGAYWFSYAKSEDEAKAEARYLLDAVKPYRMELPLCYDFEYDSVKNAASHGVEVTMELASGFASAFLSEIETGGYFALNYANPDFLSTYFDKSITQRYGLWLASWPVAKKFDLAKPPRKCYIWQWGKSSIPGIIGEVDTNEVYMDFPAEIQKAGLNHLTPAPANDALKWAQSFHITDDANLAEALWRYHNTFHTKEEYKKESGLLT